MPAGGGGGIAGAGPARALPVGDLCGQLGVLRLDVGPGPEAWPFRGRRVASERIRPSWTAMSVAGSAQVDAALDQAGREVGAAASASRSRVAASR